MKITSQDLDLISIGSSLFSTGGGLPPYKTLEIYKEIKKLKKYPNLVSIKDLKDSDYICCVSGIGDPSKVPDDIVTPIMHSFELLTSYLGRKITTIIPGEIGQEAISFLVAAKNNLKVLDADLKGGRAAPRPPINSLNLFKQAVTPIVASNIEGDELIIKKLSDVSKMEDILRQFATLAGAAFLAWSPGNKNFYKRFVVHGTISKSLELGKKISESGQPKFKVVLESVKGSKKIFEGKIANITKESTGKFTFATIVIRDNKSTAEIKVQNENLFIKVNSKVVLTCPDLITITDKKTGLGIHTTNLKKGQDVIVLGLPIDSRWKTKRGFELFSPKTFGFRFNPVII